MITVDARELANAVTILHNIPNGIDRAARSAVNKTIKGVRTDARKEVTQRYVIKAGTVQRAMTIQMARQGALEAVVRAQGRPIALSKFKVSPKRVQRRGRKNRKIAVSVRKGSSKTLNSAFAASFQSGHTGVVERVGAKRFPVKELYGPSIPQMMGNKEVSSSVNQHARERLRKNFAHGVNRILKGFGK